MLNISDIVQSAQGGAVIENLAERYGLSPEQMKAAVDALIPALSIALQRAASDPQSLGAVVETVTVSEHLAAFEQPDAAHSDQNVELGRAAVVQFFGSPAIAGQVAQLAARESGVRPDIIAQLLPVLVSVVLGGLFKSFKNQGLGPILGQLAGGGGLGQVLEQVVRGGAAPQPAPSRSGGLGGLLGALLGGLFGGAAGAARAPAPAPTPAGPAEPRGESSGLDAQSLDAAIERIKKTLQPGSVQSSPDHEISLQDILGQVLGGRR